MSEHVVEMSGINKQFNGVSVLRDVSFQVKKGEIHTLYGENGAGKSVLMKILSGVLQPDSGEIFVFGKKSEFMYPRDAHKLGIVTIHQDLNILPDLTVAENMFISNISLITKFHMIYGKKMFDKASEILSRLNFNIDSKKIVKTLSMGERQLVEIARALVQDSKLIIMDEPTSSLTGIEIDNLFRIIRTLKEKGISVIFISHRLDEILRISDCVTIMRDGEVIITDLVNNLSRKSLVSLSAGKSYAERYPKLPVQKGRVFFNVVNLSANSKIHHISFELHKGEVLGIAGLRGAGRSALARTIFGLEKQVTGSMYMNGTKLRVKTPIDAIKSGIGYVTDDRLTEGIINEFDISENITLPSLNTVEKIGIISKESEQSIGRKFIKKMVIKTPFIEQKVKNLSGGNQQKVIISKWLHKESKILIFDEPTFGLDIGSKVEVYNIMNEIVRNNSAIILISSDLPELMGMSDRIIVLCDGKINGEFKRKDFSLERILLIAAGEKDE